jgi:hypothetical protein
LCAEHDAPWLVKADADSVRGGAWANCHRRLAAWLHDPGALTARHVGVAPSIEITIRKPWNGADDRFPQPQVVLLPGAALSQPKSDLSDFGRLKVPNSGKARVRGERALQTITALAGPISAHLVPAARFCARGLHLASLIPNRGVGGAPRNVPGACEAPAGRMTRYARHLRGALRPMTRDARLSALHRGDFSPGRASFSGSASGSVERAPRSRVVVPGGRLTGPPGASRPRKRHTSLRLQDRLWKTLLDERGWPIF